MITRFIGSLLLGKEPDSGIHLQEEPQTSGDEGSLSLQLSALVRDGQLCEAEDLLFAAAEEGEPEALPAGLRFYDDLNRLSDDALARGRFSREEILSGLKELCAVCGYDLNALGWEEPAPSSGEE